MKTQIRTVPLVFEEGCSFNAMTNKTRQGILISRTVLVLNHPAPVCSNDHVVILLDVVYHIPSLENRGSIIWILIMNGTIEPLSL